MKPAFAERVVNSTAANRLLLALALTVSFSILYFFIPGAAYFVPEAAQHLNMKVVTFFLSVAGLVMLIEILVFAWIWPRRRSYEPSAKLLAMIACVVVVPYSLSNWLTGVYTYPTNMVIIGLVPVGLLLLDIRSTFIALVFGVLLLEFHDLGVTLGWLDYAPMFKPSTFTDPDMLATFEGTRKLVMYVHVLGYCSIIYFLFEQYDQQETKLHQLSMQDTLTSLANRRHFFKRLENEIESQCRTDKPLSVVMLDADHFKVVNDTHGHLVGDQVLVRIARLMDDLMRVPSDLPARLGGEEFALLLPNTELKGAQILCERLKRRLSEITFHSDVGEFHVTMSMGACCSRTGDVDAILRQTDINLYEAKTAGRNRIVGTHLSTEGSVEAASALV